MIRFAIAAALVSIGLIACSTSIERKDAMPTAVARGVNVTDIETTVASPKFSEQVAWRLTSALRERLDGRPKAAGDTPVKLKIVVTEFDVREAWTRALVGIMAADDAMEVHVDVLDESGKTIDGFDAKYHELPPAFAAFSDRNAAIISATADAIVDGLYKKQQS